MRLLTLLMLLLLPIGTVWAQGDIHRCMGANGIPVFTDRVCSDVNATPSVPAPTASAAAPLAAAQPPAVLCAADMAQLKQAVVDAFAERNPNRLAGLMLWNGDEQAAVVANIRLFSRLMTRPLLGIKTVPASSSGSSQDDADASKLSLSTSPAHGETLLVQTESADGSGTPEETRFDVVHRSGCVWLHPRS